MKKFLFVCSLASSCLLQAQTDILDARTNFSPGETVTVTGICLNGPEQGTTNRYLQDATAGIVLYPGTNWSGFSEPQPGDEVTVTGDLVDYQGVLEIADFTSLTINSSGNALPIPAILTPAQIDDAYESQLVMIEQVQFDNGGTIIQGNSGNGFTSNGESSEIYVKNGSVLVGTTLPAATITLVGIVSEYFGDYEILPRDPADFILESSINIIGQVQQGSIEYTTMELFWQTDSPGDSKIYWGPTPALGFEVYNASNTTSHTATITDLSPGNIYYANVESTNSEDTTTSIISAYATRAESSGTIQVYFTQSVDNSVATIENAIPLYGAVNDTVKAYIDRVNHTLDIAMYNFGDGLIRTAVNDAYDRGVRVRIIVEGQSTNAEVNDLNPNIPVLERPFCECSGMHNKFMICDVNIADSAIVMGGSMNWIPGDEEDDFNNILFIQDQSLARGYQIEFEEMWGTTADEPDAGNAKFGPDKSNNTPKKYWIGNGIVESYFSPSDNANQAIINTIHTTDSYLDYALFSFTRTDVADAIIDEDDLFLTLVRGLIETTDDASVYQELVDANMDVFSYQSVPGLLHHKYCIVDANATDSDPIILTGSHNWSSSANTNNDENMLIIHDARVANIYLQEFTARWTTVGINEAQLKDANWNLYPNPANTYAAVGVPAAMLPASVSVFDAAGQLVFQKEITDVKQIIALENLSRGFYNVVLTSNSKTISKKLVVE